MRCFLKMLLLKLFCKLILYLSIFISFRTFSGFQFCGSRHCSASCFCLLLFISYFHNHSHNKDHYKDVVQWPRVINFFRYKLVVRLLLSVLGSLLVVASELFQLSYVS